VQFSSKAKIIFRAVADLAEDIRGAASQEFIG
jgi:hypothetical protein